MLHCLRWPNDPTHPERPPRPRGGILMARRGGLTTLEVYRCMPSEAQMQDTMVEAVVARHGRAWHLRDARQSPELVDLPDLLVLLPTGLAMMLEVKSQRRTITTGQMAVADLLRVCDRFVGGIVRPMPKNDHEMSYDEALRLIQEDEA